MNPGPNNSIPLLGHEDDLLREEEERERKAGRPAFQPTDEHRNLVKMLAGFGFKHGDICLAIRWPHNDKPISVGTLHAHFRRELEDGPRQIVQQVATSMFKLAMAGNFAAAAFILERRGGDAWKRPTSPLAITGTPAGQTVQNSGVMLVPGMLTPDQWEDAAERMQAELKAQAGEIVGEATVVKNEPDEGGGK